MRHEAQADILVIGGGISGAFAAIKAREGGAGVLLTDKAFFGRSGCSALASGVYGAYMPGDDLEAWVKAGAALRSSTAGLRKKPLCVLTNS